MTKVADEKVLVLDFGSQYAQLIARRVRQQHVYCEIVRHDITAERIRELAPKGIILSGGPASVYEPGAPKCDPGNLPPRPARAGHLLRHAAGLRGAWAARCKARRPANTAGRTAASTDAERTVRRRARRDRRLDEPRRPGVAGLRPTSCRWPPPTPARSPPCKHRHAADLRPAVPSRGDAHARRARRSSATSSRPSAAARARGSWAISPARRSTPIRRRVGNDRVICGLSGGVDSSVVAALLAQAIGPQLSCILVDNGLLRKDEEEVGHPASSPTTSRPICTSSRPKTSFSTRSGRRGRSAGEAAADRPRLHRVLCRRGGEDRGRPVPRPGHALSRRDRERRLARRPGRHDQAAPQRRRTARGLGLRADRAAARPVQGRGPHAGPAARPAGGHRLAASVPRARAWPSAAWAR